MEFSVEVEDKGTAASFKLFGSSIPFFSHSQGSQLFIDRGRSSSGKDVAASMAGICSQSPLYFLGGGKASKEVEEEESPEGATICINNNGNRELLEEPKKPHLPCPRCKSLYTKFCYFNNYSIKQPRHFCKKCQRYWTAGGTQRNVPEGSGQRKTSAMASATGSCGTDNPVLGKHPREGLPIAVVNGGCLLTPKLLRIRDSEEAAQSSIQSSMGLDNNMPK